MNPGDLIISPPGDSPYDALREQLIKRTTASEQWKLQQFFSAEELGGRKPTQMLHRIQQLLGERTIATDNTFVRELFLQRLPNNVRMMLASTPTAGNLDQLAELADKIIDVASPAISSFQQQDQPPQRSTEVE